MYLLSNTAVNQQITTLILRMFLKLKKKSLKIIRKYRSVNIAKGGTAVDLLQPAPHLRGRTLLKGWEAEKKIFS